MSTHRIDDPYGLRERPGVYDTGTGAIKTVESNPGIPGIERVIIRTYCGKAQDNRIFYRLSANRQQEFATLAEALAARKVHLT
jgi:hypothetical protein